MNSFQIPTATAACAILAMTGIVALTQHAQATPVTQSIAPAGSYSASNWAWDPLGSITLAKGTKFVSALTSTATLVDQGWGGQDPANNQVQLSLFDNGVDLWNQHVAGATHTSSTQTYNIANDPAALTSLDAALAGINWTTSPTVTMQMNAVPVAYSGWELTTSNASFSMTSEVGPVPEPASFALLGVGLGALGVIRRRRAA